MGRNPRVDARGGRGRCPEFTPDHVGPRGLGPVDCMRERCIVVARAGLGTINHSLLTLHAARQAGLAVAAVVPNHPEPEAGLSETDKKIEADNREIIQSLSGVTVFPPLPPVPGAGERVEPTRRLAGLLAERGMERLIDSIQL